MSLRNFVHFLGWCFLLLVVVFFVNPLGDFPLNDDWHYAPAVQSLLENGSYDLRSEFSPNIFLQVIWGYLFCLVPGEFSFTYLRISTLVGAAIGGYVFFQIIKNQGGRNFQERILFTTFLIFNPLFFSLAFTFMTDVPFLTLILASVFFYKKYWSGGVDFQSKNKFRFLGAAFAIAAFFIRQPGILIWLGAEFSIFVFGFLKNKKVEKSISKIFKSKAFLFFVLNFLTAILLYLFVEKIMKPGLGVAENYISVSDEYINTLVQSPLKFIFQFSKRSLMTVFYLGLFCLPLASLIFEKIKNNRLSGKWIFGNVLLFNFLTTYFLYQSGYIFPYGGNIFYNLGLGPVLTTDINYQNLFTGFEISNYAMIGFGLICQIFGSYIFLLFFQKIKRAIRAPLQNQFFLSLIFINIIYLSAMMIFSFFDRYLLLLFASVLIILFSEKSERKIYQHKSFCVLMIVMMWFSVAATKDYLTINRTIDAAFQNLKNRGIRSKLIDAGLSQNRFSENMSIENTHEYRLSFNELEKYELIDSLSFYRWTFLKNDEILVLQKEK